MNLFADSNVVFSIIILENLRKSLWIMRNQNNEKIENNNWGFVIFCYAHMPRKIPKQRKGDRALWLWQARGLSAAATCLTFKSPPAASHYAGISQILFFWIYKIQSLSLSLFWNLTGHVRTTKIGKCLIIEQDYLFSMIRLIFIFMFLYMTYVVYCRTFLHFMPSLFNNLKKSNSEKVSTPKLGVLNIEFALKLRIYRFLKSLICLKLIRKKFSTTLYTQFNYLT